MPKIIMVDPNGQEHTVEAAIGEQLVHAAVDANVPGIEASCGGNCVCSTCQCHLQEELYSKLPEPDEMEAEMLEAKSEVLPTSRLICQLTVDESFEGARIQVASTQH